MEADTTAMRAAAGRLRDEAATALREATRAAGRTADRQVLALTFDHYTTSEPFEAAATAWRAEIEALAAATDELAAAIVGAADAYKAADARAATRTGGPR